MKTLAGLCASLLAAVAATTADAAMITFNVSPGDATFDPVSGRFEAVGSVVAADGVPSTIVNQSFRLAALLATVDVGTSAVTASFGGVVGADLEVPGFLAGELAQLSLTGVYGFDFGSLVGSVALTGPAAAHFGGDAGLFALQFNMSTAFSADTFSSPFSAALNGTVQGVPGPSVAMLMLAGLLVVGVASRRRAAVAGSTLDVNGSSASESRTAVGGVQ